MIFRAGLLRAGVALLALALLASVRPQPATAADTGEVRREILAIYDGDHEEDPSNTLIHRLAEMPLNHLGYVLRYADVRQPLPAPAEAARFAGVLSWFAAPLAQPGPYLDWLAAAGEQGARLVIMGEVGGDPFEPAKLPAINRVLALLGLRHEGDGVLLTHRSRVTVIRPELMAFEGPLDPVLPAFPLLQRIAPETRVALEVATGDGRRSALVVTGPAGGFVANGFDFAGVGQAGRYRWLLNPFEFFREALGDVRFPIPDVTTVSGRRIYYSHVDGDGWLNVSAVGKRRDRVLSSEVMLRELIEPYPDLPVTVGAIASDIDVSGEGNREAAEIARRIFALPQVEIGSHTCTHPFNWDFFANYDRAKEQALMDAAGKDVAGSAALPRAYMRSPFVIDYEVNHAVTVSNALAPPGKRVMIYQWSGNAMAFEKVIAKTRAAGLRNINGGDTRFDGNWPSVGYVAPIARTVGRERQIYAGNSNENNYTNDWTGPFWAFRALEQTLDNTERPRRLKGFNLYYHTYSAEKQASLDAVKYLLDLARRSPVVPLAASQYAEIADSYFGVRLKSEGSGAWSIHDRGSLQTLRFDRADDLAIDWTRSTGVLGSNRHQGSLYIALDAAVETPVVAVRERAEPQSAPVSLVESRWLVEGLARNGDGFTFRARGFGHGDFVFEGGRAGTYAVSAERGGRVVWSGDVEAAPGGRLGFSLPVDGMETLDVRVAFRNGGS